LLTLQGVLQIANHYQIELDGVALEWGECLEVVWGELVEPKINNPVFITHHPASISPLSRRCDDNPLVTDRFELIIAGMEMANGFSELNDPFDQRERFMGQQAQAQKEGREACIDEDFLTALEVGLPPTAGEGIGIDRLVMLFTNSTTIRDVVLFPQLKREE
jgi:lysyl-tRNA synthetase class 2